MVIVQLVWLISALPPIYHAQSSSVHTHAPKSIAPIISYMHTPTHTLTPQVGPAYTSTMSMCIIPHSVARGFMVARDSDSCGTTASSTLHVG